MPFLTRWIATICFSLLLTFSWSQPSLAVEDAIIAIVNDELITLKDLKDYVRSTYVSLVAEGLDDTQIQAHMKDMEINGTNKLIEDKLILSKANNIGIKVREALVDERIEEMQSKYGSEQKLVEALIKNGATLTDLRNKIQLKETLKPAIEQQSLLKKGKIILIGTRFLSRNFIRLTDVIYFLFKAILLTISSSFLWFFLTMVYV